MRYLPFSLVVAVLCFVSAHAEPPQVKDLLASGSPALPPQDQIFDCVTRFTGLDTLFTIESAERVTLSELNIPFLAAQNKDQTGIRVDLTPGKINWPLPHHGFEDPYVRHFAVYLDTDAKRILAVTSRLAERSPDIHAELSPEEAEKRLRLSEESYDSFPTVDPGITFMDALESVRKNGIASPSVAQEIDGFYVMYGLRREKPQPVWVINLRGLPPLAFPGIAWGGRAVLPPAWKRNYMRNIVDGVTGKWLSGANGPGPR